MRPRGRVREILVASAMQKPATLRELQVRCCVGYAAARWALADAVRYGDLAKVGQRREPHARRPCVVYGAVPATHATGEGGVGDALAGLAAVWAVCATPLAA